MGDPKDTPVVTPTSEDSEEALRHHEFTGTTSVKKPDPTTPPRPGKVGTLEEEEEVHMHGTGGGRPGIGLPDHPADGPQEALEVEGIVER